MLYPCGGRRFWSFLLAFLLSPVAVRAASPALEAVQYSELASGDGPLLSYRDPDGRVFYYTSAREPVGVMVPAQDGGHWIVSGHTGTYYTGDGVETNITVRYFDDGTSLVRTPSEGRLFDASGKATGLRFFHLDDGTLIYAKEADGDTFYYDKEGSLITTQSRLANDNPAQPLNQAPAYQHQVATSPDSMTARSASGTTYYSGDVTGTSVQVGSTTFHHFSDGQNGSSQRVGSTTFHNVQGGGRALSGSSQQIGTTSFHSFSNGVTGTSQQVGTFRFDRFSNGRNCTTQKIGSFAFTNCH